MYILKMTNSPCPNSSAYRTWLQIIQLISMKTRDKPYFLALLHYFYARLSLEEVFLAKHINENWRNLFWFHRFRNSWNLRLYYIFGLLSLCFSFGNGMSPTKSTNNCQFILIFFLSYLYSFKHFYLIFWIEAISRFNLHCCST